MPNSPSRRWTSYSGWRSRAANRRRRYRPDPQTCILGRFPSTYSCSGLAEFPAASQIAQQKEANMTWKKVLGITAVTLIPGGLVVLGGWLAVKKLRSSHEEVEKSRSDLAKQRRGQAEKEAEHDIHPISNQ